MLIFTHIQQIIKKSINSIKRVETRNIAKENEILVDKKALYCRPICYSHLGAKPFAWMQVKRNCNKFCITKNSEFRFMKHVWTFFLLVYRLTPAGMLYMPFHRHKLDIVKHIKITVNLQFYNFHSKICVAWIDNRIPKEKEFEHDVILENIH